MLADETFIVEAQARCMACLSTSLNFADSNSQPIKSIPGRLFVRLAAFGGRLFVRLPLSACLAAFGLRRAWPLPASWPGFGLVCGYAPSQHTTPRDDSVRRTFFCPPIWQQRDPEVVTCLTTKHEVNRF